MKPYIKTYLKHFHYLADDFIPCEICGRKSVDFHHIECRGMGGSKIKDNIENIMALCRECHLEYGDKKVWKKFLKENHEQKLTKK